MESSAPDRLLLPTHRLRRLVLLERAIVAERVVLPHQRKILVVLATLRQREEEGRSL